MNTARFTQPSGLLTECKSPYGSAYWSFIPNSLPPAEEPQLVAELANLLSEANHALGQLDGVGQILPNPDLLIRPYMRREAVLSSRIEGTQTSFSELVAFEAATHTIPEGDVREVHNYVVALDYGLRRVSDGGITRGILETMHRHLLADVRGEAFGTPGEFRNVQNHIGGGADPAQAHFVPPPPEEMHRALDDLVDYLKTRAEGTPLLVQAAWMHYQFETIHPFLDGNGRVGRLLVPLLVAWRRRLAHPLLYLSPYFEARRDTYYDLLFAVSAASRWRDWLQFFLEGVLTQAREGVSLSREILELGRTWSERLNHAHASRSAHRLADVVHQHIAVDAKTAERMLGVAGQTAYNAIRSLEQVGILTELTGRTWGRVYIAPELVAILDRPSR